jgi:hypothetical protein
VERHAERGRLSGHRRIPPGARERHSGDCAARSASVPGDVRQLGPWLNARARACR